jgi:hypothetical protein
MKRHRQTGRGFGFAALAIAALVAAGSLTGCAGYRLGPTNGMAPREKSVQVNAFVNRTLEPRFSDAVTLELRKVLEHDGTYQLATHDDGDVVISGEIIKFERLELSFSPTDVLTARDYRLQVTARVTARERSSGKTLIDQPVLGTTLVRIGNDISSAERQALPLIANDLARNVTSLLVDGAW